MAPKIFSIFLASAATGWTYRTLFILNGLVTLTFVMTTLSKVEFGIWVLVVQAVGLLSMSDLGISTAISRQIARYRGLNDRDGVNSSLCTSFLLMAGFGLFVGLATLALVPWISDILKIDNQYSSLTKFVFIVCGLSLALQFPLRLGQGILLGHQMYGIFGVGKILSSLIDIAGVITLFLLGMLNLKTLAFLSVAGNLFSQSVLMLVAWRKTSPWNFNKGHISFVKAKEIISLGASFELIAISNMIYNQGIIIMVGRTLSTEAAGIFGFSVSLVRNIQGILGAISAPFITLAGEMHASNKSEILRKTNSVVMRVTFALSLCSAVGIFFYGEQVLKIWLHRSQWNDENYRQAIYALTIMTAGLTVGLPQISCRSILQGIGRHWVVSYGFIAACILSLLISLPAIRYYGLFGAALSWALVWVIEGIVIYPPLICRYFLKEKILDMFIRAYTPGAYVGILVALIAWILSSVHIFHGKMLNLLFGLCICFFAGLFATLIASGESRLIFGKINLIVRKIIGKKTAGV